VLPGDEVFVLADKEHIRQVLRPSTSLEAGAARDDRRRRQGGPAPGAQPVGQCEVKIIERDRKRCEYLASQLPSTCWCCRATAPTKTC
jgi:trk system potassium uptake protein TrkA